jgi:hypothetical protein
MSRMLLFGAALQDLVDDAVLESLVGRHVVVAVGILADLLHRLPRVLGDDLVERVPDAQHFARVDLDIRCLPLGAADRLMHEDSRVGQRKAFALGSGAQQHLRHRGSQANADGADVGAHVLHRVVDRQPSRDTASRGVDVEVDVPMRVLALQKEQLGNGQAGDVVVNGGSQEDDALLEQPRVDVVGALTPAGLLHNDWDQLPVQQVGRKREQPKGVRDSNGAGHSRRRR